jgi:hypothetical protein
MNNELSVLTFLPLASFAIALAGVLVRLSPFSQSAKAHILSACLVFLLLSSGLIWFEQNREQRQILKTAVEIRSVIGNDKKTYDEISSSLRRPNYIVAERAVEKLLSEGWIRSELVEVSDKTAVAHRVRLYFVIRFD